MAFFAHVVVCLSLAVAHASVAGTSLLMRGAIRSRTHTGASQGFRYSRHDPAAQTLLTLDTDHDGRIDPSEIAAFAHLQGLDAASATEEFSSIDANGDGVLDSTELNDVFSAPSPAAATAALSATQGSVSESAGAPEQVMPDSHDALTPADSGAARVDTVTELAPTEAEAASSQSAGPQEDAPVAVEPALAPASVPVQAELVSQPRINTELISHEARESMRNTAQQISEALMLEESEETKARDLDRKAAELRAKSASLAKLTMQDAQDAGVKAARAKTVQLLAKLTELQGKEQKAEVRAAALHAKSELETEQASYLMAVADDVIKSS